MTQLNPSEATSLALNTLSSQIRAIIQMPDGPAKVAIGSFETLLNANFTMISEAANEHIDEYNALIDELEARDRELLAQARLVSELRQQVAGTDARIAAALDEANATLEAKDAELYAAQRALNAVETKCSAMTFTARQLERQLNEFKALDPVGMKRRIKEKNDLLEQQRTAIAQHKRNEAGYRKEVLDKERHIKALLAAINDQDVELAERQQVIDDMAAHKDIELLWGKHLRKHYPDERGQRWNIYLLENGVQTDQNHLLNDLAWKLIAMRQDGQGCIVTITEWLTPTFPKSDVASEIPMQAIQDIHEFVIDVVIKTHPHLLPRAEWAQTVSIHECALPPRTVKPLEEAGLDTLYKVMINQGSVLNKVKGLGEKLLAQLLYACELKVKQWEQQFAAGNQSEQQKEAA